MAFAGGCSSKEHYRQVASDKQELMQGGSGDSRLPLLRCLPREKQSHEMISSLSGTRALGKGRKTPT